MPYGLPQLQQVQPGLASRSFALAQEAARRNELLRMQQEAAMRQQQQETLTNQAMSEYMVNQPEMQDLAPVARVNPQAAMQIHKMKGDLTKERIQQAKEGLELAGMLLSSNEMSVEMYPAFREHMIRDYQIPENMLPQSFTDQASFNRFRQNVGQKLPSALQQLQMLETKLGIEDKISARDKPSFHSYQVGDEVVTEEWTPTGGRREVGRGVKRPDVATNIDMRQENAEAKEYGTYLVRKDFGALDARAKAAEELIPQFEIARNIDIEAGRFEPAKGSLNAIIEGLGFDSQKWGLEQADNAQAITGILQNVVLTKMQAQKGPQTENDAKRIEMTVASLKNTPEAYKFLLNAAQALEERAVEQRDFYLAHRDRTGSFEGAAQGWNRYKRSTPLIGKEPESKRLVFFNEYRRLMAQQFPGASEEEILENWRAHFAK